MRGGYVSWFTRAWRSCAQRTAAMKLFFAILCWAHVSDASAPGSTGCGKLGLETIDSCRLAEKQRTEVGRNFFAHFWSKSYFSDRRRKGPRKMAGITALIPNLGSRIARPILSGYRSGDFPSKAPKASVSVSRQPSTAEFQQSSGAESRRPSATGPRQSGVGEVRQPSAGELRQPNVTDVRQTSPAEFPDDGLRRSQSEPISLPEIMSFGNTNVDLPMRRSLSDPGSDCAPSGGSKVHWCDPLKIGPPMDGRYMPCLPSAIPRLSAMKGGREGRIERNSGLGGTRGIDAQHSFSESCAAVNESSGAGEGQGQQSGGKVESKGGGDGGVVEAERGETTGNALPRHGAGRMGKSSLASASFVSNTTREENGPLSTTSHDPVSGAASPRPQQAHGSSRFFVQSGLAKSPATPVPTARAYVPPGPPSAPAAKAPSAKKVGVQIPKASNPTAKGPTPRATIAQETVEQASPTLRTHAPKATAAEASDAELLNVQASAVQRQDVPAPMRSALVTQEMAAKGSNAQARKFPTPTTKALPTTQASTPKVWAKASPVQASVLQDLAPRALTPSVPPTNTPTVQAQAPFTRIAQTTRTPTTLAQASQLPVTAVTSQAPATNTPLTMEKPAATGNTLISLAQTVRTSAVVVQAKHALSFQERASQAQASDVPTTSAPAAPAQVTTSVAQTALTTIPVWQDPQALSVQATTSQTPTAISQTTNVTANPVSQGSLAQMAQRSISQVQTVQTPAAVMQTLPVVPGQPPAADAKTTLTQMRQAKTMRTPTVPAPSSQASDVEMSILQASSVQARTSENPISQAPETNASTPRFAAAQVMIGEAPTTPALIASTANSRIEPVQEQTAQEPNSQAFAANVPTVHELTPVSPVSSIQAPAVEELSHVPHAKSNAVEAPTVEIENLRASLSAKLSAVLSQLASARVQAAQDTTRESVAQSPRIRNSTPARSVTEGPNAEKPSTVALSGSEGEAVASGAESAHIGEAGPSSMPSVSDKNGDASTKASTNREGGGAEEHGDGAPEVVAVRDDVSEASSVSSSDSQSQNESSACNERPSGGVTVRLCDHLAQVRQLATGSDVSLSHEVDLKSIVRRESVDSGAEERGRELLSAMMMMSDGERDSSRRDDGLHVHADDRHIVDVTMSGVDWSDHDHQVVPSTEDLIDSRSRDVHSMDDHGLEGTVAETEENDEGIDRGEDAEEDKGVAHMQQAVIRVEEAARDIAPESMDLSGGSDAARSMNDESALSPFHLGPSASARVHSSVLSVGGRVSHGDAVTRNAFLLPTPYDDAEEAVEDEAFDPEADGGGNESCVPPSSPTPGDTDGDHEGEACLDGAGTTSSVPTTSFAPMTWQVLPTPRTSAPPGSPCSAACDAQSVLHAQTRQAPAANSEDGSDGSKNFSVEHKYEPLIPRVPWSKPPRLARASSAVEQVRQGAWHPPRSLARRSSEPPPSTSPVNATSEAFLQSSVSVDAPSRLLNEGPGVREAEKIAELELDAPGVDFFGGREAKERIACDSPGVGDKRIKSPCHLSEAPSVIPRDPQRLAPVNEARSAGPLAPSLSGNNIAVKGRDGLTKTVPWRPPNRIQTQKPRVVIPAPARCDSRDPASVVVVATLAGKRTASPSVSTSTTLSEQDRVTDDGRDGSRTSPSSGSSSGGSSGKSESFSSERAGRSRDSFMGSSASRGQSGQNPRANDRTGGIPKACYASNRESSSTSCSDESSPRGGSGSGSEGRRRDDRTAQSGDRGRRNGRTGRSRSRSSSESSSYRRSRRASDSSDRYHSYVGRRGRDRDDYDRERDERYSRSRRDYSYSRIDWGHCWVEEWASRPPRRTRSSSR